MIKKVITWFIGRTEPPAGPGLEEAAVGRDGEDADHHFQQTQHLEGLLPPGLLSMVR